MSRTNYKLKAERLEQELAALEDRRRLAIAMAQSQAEALKRQILWWIESSAARHDEADRFRALLVRVSEQGLLDNILRADIARAVALPRLVLLRAEVAAAQEIGAEIEREAILRMLHPSRGHYAVAHLIEQVAARGHKQEESTNAS